MFVSFVVQLMIAGVVALVCVAVLGILWAVAYLCWWVLFLPFKLFGVAVKGLIFMLMLPLILIAGVVMTLVFGFNVIGALIPAALFVLLVVGVFRLLRPRGHSAA
jgi:hypothetical protein